jgi:hypothetical protein
MSRPSLSQAIREQLEPSKDIKDWAWLLSTSRRTIERMRAAGKLPKPDFYAGSMPRWRAQTVRAWMEKGGAA